MRAMVIDGYGKDPVLRDIEPPGLGPGQVRIRVTAAAINPADLKVASGKDGARFLKAAKFPLPIGYDFAGSIAELGSGVTGLDAGDRVFGFLPYSSKTRQGSLVESLVADAAAIAPLPDGVGEREAAASATVASTALQALRDAGRLRQGDRVLVNGASGGVGSVAVQIARVLGAEVWGTSSAAKKGFVQELGVTRAIDYREQPIGDIDGRFAVVFDAASRSSFLECRGLLDRGGAYVTLLPTPRFVAGKIASLLSSKRCHVVIVKPRRTDLATVAGWIAAGQLDVPIDSSYPLADAATAMAHLASGEVSGKIAIEVG